MMQAVDDITLNAYLDGELDSAAVRDVEMALARDPELRRRLDQLSQSTALLRAALAPALHELLPDKLSAIAGAPTVASASEGAEVVPFAARAAVTARRRWIVPASLAASLLLAAIGANYSYERYFVRGDDLPRLIAGDYWLDAVSNFHQVYTRIYANESRALVDIPGDNAEQVNSFFGPKLRRNLQVPDLTAHGLWLQGGRLLVIQGKPSAQIVYVAQNGKTLALSILSSTGRDVAPILERRRDANVLHWRRDGFNYALVGEMDPALMRTIAEEIAPKMFGA